jgi:hypothetical protein
LATSLVQLVVAELGMLLSGSNIGGIITMAISDLEGKALITRGIWLGVKPFGMSYEGFSDGSSGAEGLGAYGEPETLYGLENVHRVFKKILNHLLACT